MTLDELLDIFWKEFKEAGVPFLLIGGLAVNCYKQEKRVTIDVDFLTTEENFDKVLSQLEKKRCRQISRNKLFAKMRTSESPFDVDVVFVDPESFQGLFEEAREFEIKGIKFKIPSLEHLIALKLHAAKQDLVGRDYRDLSDILALMRENRMDPRTPQFLDLCLKFGNESLYQMILQASEKWR